MKRVAKQELHTKRYISRGTQDETTTRIKIKIKNKVKKPSI